MCPYSEFSVKHFPAFGLNTNIYRLKLRILSKCGKMQTRKTPNMDTFYAVTETEACRGILSNSCSENIHKILRSMVRTLSHICDGAYGGI